MGDEFETKSNAFISWFESQPNAHLNPKIALVDYRSRRAGRGVIAKDDIEEDEVLFSIPRASILTALNSQVSTLPDFPADPWLGLILVLIFEHLQGAASPWAPYLAILPAEQDFDTLMYWTDAQLAHLQASAVRDKIGRASADALFESELLPFVETHADAFYPDGTTRLSDEEIMRLAHRMGSTIMAYAFDLEPSEEAKQLDDEGFVSDDEDEMLPKGMLPMADMLNADAESNARLVNGDDTLSMVAQRRIPKDEEVLNDYGPLPRSDLLRRYGYITPAYAQYDVVEIPHGLVMAHVKAHASTAGINDIELDKRLEHLSDLSLLDAGYDIERKADTSPSSPDTAAGARVHVPDELVHLMKVLLAGPDVPFAKLHRLSDEQVVTLMGTVGGVAGGILSERLAQYATSVAEDRALLAGGELTARERMAVEVRLGEKELLMDAVGLARTWKGGVNGTAEEGEEGPSQKKRRTA